MSNTVLTGKSKQVPMRLEFDILAWIAWAGGGSRGTATVAKERLRGCMNADIASGQYKPKRAAKK